LIFFHQFLINAGGFRVGSELFTKSFWNYTFPGGLMIGTRDALRIRSGLRNVDCGVGGAQWKKYQE
jgi:hypothetical protein